MDVAKLNILPVEEAHYPSVAKIYADGMATGIATFETKVPTWKQWDEKFLKEGRFIVSTQSQIIGWCALSSVSKREVYKGVAEVTIYISTEFQGKGVGKLLLNHLVGESEKLGFWTLQARIFPQNIGSIQLHQKCGFREIGFREKIGQRNGIWYDNIALERRSKKINYMKNVLVLCTGNSCRSQMVHGYLKTFGKEKLNVFSAGIETHGLNPGAVSIMAEDGIDITTHTSNHVDEYQHIPWDYIITVCDHANENCPFIPAPNAKRLHHNFSDPSRIEGSKEEKHAAFEKTRNEIKEYCRNFIDTYL